MTAKSAKAIIESLRKGLPPEPFEPTVSVTKSPEEIIHFSTPQTIILEIEPGNGQRHALLEMHQQSQKQGFVTYFLKLGQGEAPVLKNANHILWQISQTIENPIVDIEITKTSNLLSQMLGWEEDLVKSQSLLKEYFQAQPPKNKELFFHNNKNYQALLKAIATFSAANKQTILFLDGIEAELNDYKQDNDYQAAWENLAYLLTEQNYLKCICALSPAFIHSFSFKMLLRKASSLYPPQIIIKSEWDCEFIASLCQKLAEIYKIAYEIQIPCEVLYQKAVAVSSIRGMVKIIVQTLDDVNET
jgi:hypothetical protein